MPVLTEVEVEIEVEGMGLVDAAGHHPIADPVAGPRVGIAQPPLHSLAGRAAQEDLDAVGLAAFGGKAEAVGLDLGEDTDRLEEVLVAHPRVADLPLVGLDSHR